mmetsp:Transcript_2989/g.10727  ORF Transcript_2989/g.10727 Transcript_2989/m.10727 type:complete len:226 (+) Transcript_2989:415-1092(+)
MLTWRQASVMPFSDGRGCLSRTEVTAWLAAVLVMAPPLQGPLTSGVAPRRRRRRRCSTQSISSCRGRSRPQRAADPPPARSSSSPRTRGRARSRRSRTAPSRRRGRRRTLRFALTTLSKTSGCCTSFRTSATTRRRMTTASTSAATTPCSRSSPCAFSRPSMTLSYAPSLRTTAGANACCAPWRRRCPATSGMTCASASTSSRRRIGAPSRCARPAALRRSRPRG